MLAERTKNVAAAATRKLFHQVPLVNAWRKTLGLPPVINLTLGQPHLPINPRVVEKLQAAINHPDIATQFGYSPTRGRPQTLEAIVRLYKHYYPNVDYTPEEVMCSVGANQSLWNAFNILIEEKNNVKDVVLAYEPFFAQYKVQIKALGGELQAINTSNHDWQPTAIALQEALERYPQTKALLINFPNNPMGMMFEKHEIEQVATLLAEYPQIAIIQDDVYQDLSYQPFFSILGINPNLKNRTIVINSVSKGLIGGPDIRIGITAAPKTWIEAMMMQQLLQIASVPWLSQHALITAIDAKLEGTSQAWEEERKAIYQRNLQLFAEQLQKIGLPVIKQPAGAFYLIIDASKLLGKNIPDHLTVTDSHGATVELEGLWQRIGTTCLTTDVAIADFFLYAAGVAMVPTSGFGMDPAKGILRIACTVDQDKFATAIRQLQNTLAQISA